MAGQNGEGVVRDGLAREEKGVDGRCGGKVLGEKGVDGGCGKKGLDGVCG